MHKPMSARRTLAALLALLPAVVGAEEFASEFADTCNPKRSCARLSAMNAESRQRLRQAQAGRSALSP